MIRANGKTPFVLFALVCLNGCATNALRVEYATDVVNRAKVATTASRAYLARVDESRVLTNVDLLGLDPACIPNTAYIREVPNLKAMGSPVNPKRGWLCVPNAAGPVPGARPFSLAAITEDLEPTFQLIEALGAYSSAISKIVDEKGPDPVKDIVDALALARSAEGLIVAVAGSKPVLPGAEDKRLAALTSFIGFLQELQTENSKVKQLRVLMESKQGSSGIITSLRDHLSAWELGRAADETLRVVFAGTLLGEFQRAEPVLPADDRKEIARIYYDRLSARSSSRALAPAVNATLVELASADADLRRVLQNNPELSAKERERLAEITRQRVGRALDNLAAIVTAFRGI